MSFGKIALIISGLSLCFQTSIYAKDVTFQWDANTETDIDHYVVHWGTSSFPPYANNSGDIDESITTYAITGLDLEQYVYYFAVKAFDTEGLESEWSDVVSSDGSTPPPTQPFPSPSSSGNGCFIATAAYGSNMDWHVKILTKFRDKHLVTNPIGRSIVEGYYKFSPPVADYLHNHPLARAIVRYALIPITGIAYLSLSIHPLVLLFAFFFMLLIGVYFFKRSEIRRRHVAM
jgi:hypothetical protein